MLMSISQQSNADFTSVMPGDVRFDARPPKAIE
jgi:hypothetical protein